MLEGCQMCKEEQEDFECKNCGVRLCLACYKDEHNDKNNTLALRDYFNHKGYCPLCSADEIEIVTGKSKDTFSSDNIRQGKTSLFGSTPSGTLDYFAFKSSLTMSLFLDEFNLIGKTIKEVKETMEIIGKDEILTWELNQNIIRLGNKISESSRIEGVIVDRYLDILTEVTAIVNKGGIYEDVKLLLDVNLRNQREGRELIKEVETLYVDISEDVKQHIKNYVEEEERLGESKKIRVYDVCLDETGCISVESKFRLEYITKAKQFYNKLTGKFIIESIGKIVKKCVKDEFEYADLIHCENYSTDLYHTHVRLKKHSKQGICRVEVADIILLRDYSNNIKLVMDKKETILNRLESEGIDNISCDNCGSNDKYDMVMMCAECGRSICMKCRESDTYICSECESILYHPEKVKEILKGWYDCGDCGKTELEGVLYCCDGCGTQKCVRCYEESKKCKDCGDELKPYEQQG